MTSEDVDPEVAAVLGCERERPWPGPDRYTLRGWAEVEIALDGEQTLDAAHAVLSDGLRLAFGPRVVDWVGTALAAEGRTPGDLAALVDDEELLGRVLARLHARMAEDDEAPDPPPTGFGWSAYAPGSGRSGP